MAIEKTCQQCGNLFETNRTHSKYCSEQCKKLAFYDRHAPKTNMNGIADVPPFVDDADDDDKVKTPPSSKVMAPKPQSFINSMDPVAQFIISEKDKQIEFYKKEYEEERAKRKKVKNELAAVNTELSELKTANKIAEVAKPKGLSGLASNLEPFLNHPLVIGLGQKLMNLGPMQMEGMPAADGNPLAPLINWINGLSEEARHAFAMLVTELAKTEDQVQLTTLLQRMVTMVSTGSTIGGNAQHATANATGTYGY